MPLSAFLANSAEPTPSFAGVSDEYDPLRPNEYDEYSRKMRHRKREEERQKEHEEKER